MSDLPSLAAVIGFAPGAIGGVCNVVVGHPIDLVKVRLQTAAASGQPAANAMIAAAAQPSTFGALNTIFRTEGVVGLYRGVAAPLLAVTPAFAITFWSYDFATRFLRRNESPESEQTLSQTVIAGGFSGIPLAMVFGPSERIKCLMQVNKHAYSSFWGCARSLYAEGGMRSIFRGTTATMMRDCPGNAAYFGTYELVKRNLSAQFDPPERSSPSLGVTFMAGGFAGISNWIIAIPFDVIKSRYQTAPAGTYKNLFEVLQQLLAKEGPGALFRGLSPALLRAFPANAACLAGVETAKKCFALYVPS
mmetsp:Transcript_2450/g.3317  ORF Transcript_2450/g.3317 Transcript_2450/m.3317 type:complete len:305 (-) Transcript_2450:217-1131(-)|eukprot:CAMPEP_0194030580 /NCGR_PEP_ID=MMETSP0009_2-20130614/4010_1 /TAXON_ID=210454 /ORGANISM="Grammatophora oceanica, Strain CCMP 410" /LENGTH=304 /DNA_ID=CAMNT_0038670551 /DNA_START=112 /DNA_END=1026 /DNA_ORIENTATION=-